MGVLNLMNVRSATIIKKMEVNAVWMDMMRGIGNME